MTETWKITTENNKYSVSNLGRIKRNSTGKILNPFHNAKGYRRIHFYLTRTERKAYFVHRLVASNFIEEVANGYCVNHKNGDKQDNRLTNLEIITLAQNCHHAMFVLQTVNSNLNIPQVRVIKHLLSQKIPQKTIANIFKIHPAAVSQIANGKVWQSI